MPLFPQEHFPVLEFKSHWGKYLISYRAEEIDIEDLDFLLLFLIHVLHCSVLQYLTCVGGLF